MPHSDMIVRPVRRDDLRDLVALCAAHAAYEGAAYQHEGKVEGLAALFFGVPQRLYGLVVEEAGRGLVGFATWSVQVSTWAADRYAHMDCLYLAPEARNRGLGRRLMADIARAALDAGCAEVQWQTPASNGGAIRFYERLGATARPKVRFYLGHAELHPLTTDAPTHA